MEEFTFVSPYLYWGEMKANHSILPQLIIYWGEMVEFIFMSPNRSVFYVLSEHNVASILCPNSDC